MKISSAYPSKYVKSSDLGGRTITVTIDRVLVENVGGDQAEEHKPVLYFQGKEKGLVLNKTNAESIAYVHGDETDNWVGKQIELFTMMVSYNNRMTPGLRVRAIGTAEGQHVPDHSAPMSSMPQPTPGAQSNVGIDDDIPF